MKQKILSRLLVWKCGCTVAKDYIHGRLESAIVHAQSTRCIDCFNSVSLRPSLTLIEGYNAWVDTSILKTSFITSDRDRIQCTIVRVLEDDEIVVRLLESVHAGSNFTVNIKYVSQY